jgi:uncharacterized SAM-binding protein YcdF (DUF218 family)
MVFTLSKILLFIIKPIVWIFCLFLWAILTKNAVRRKKITTVGLIALFVFSNTFIVGKIFNLYETTYPIEQHYNVGVVLGGFSGINKRTGKIAFNWASDRLFEAISLYRTGKIDKILITSGNANLVDKQIKEGDLVYHYLREIGIADSAILIENKSRNTIENAALSYKLIKKLDPKAKILVITSAWHIPRAKMIFSKQFGDNISFYPTNFIGKTNYDIGDYLIPSAGALSNWELIFKEWVGYLVDKFRT